MTTERVLGLVYSGLLLLTPFIIVWAVKHDFQNWNRWRNRDD